MRDDARSNASRMPFARAGLVNDGPLWHGRRPRGVPMVMVMSALEAARVRPRSARGVIISIRDPDARPVPLTSRWAAVLRLELPDIWRENQPAPTQESLAKQAEALVAFVHAHRRSPLIAFHCRTGVTGSRTAASAVCQHFDWPYEWKALHHPWALAIRLAFLLAEFDAEYRQLQDPNVWQATKHGFEAPLGGRVGRQG